MVRFRHRVPMRLDPNSLKVSLSGKNLRGRRIYSIWQGKRLLVKGTRAEVHRYLDPRLSKRDQRAAFARVA